jgi:hypothetical protein
MRLQPLHTGVLVESARGLVAAVDTARHRIEIRTVHAQRTFEATRRGLRDASTLLLRLVDRQRAAPGHDDVNPTAQQPDLFAAGAATAPRAHRAHALAHELQEALRRAARRVLPDMDAIAGVVNDPWPTPLVFSRAVLDARVFQRDVLRFPAAAFAAAFVECVSATRPPATHVDELRRRLDNWRALYSPTHVATRAVNKTLARFGAGEHVVDLWALSDVDLERPVQSALHLEVLAARSRILDDTRRVHLQLLQHVDERELAELVARACNTPSAARERGGGGAEILVNVLVDAREARPRGGLRALVRAGLRRRPRRAHETTHGDDGAIDSNVDHALALPPIPLPDDENIRFLARLFDVYAEAEHMRHCIRQRTFEATVGTAFLFHVVHGNSEASIEVDENGTVTQAAGPANIDNAAAAWGRARLQVWGSGFWAARMGGFRACTWQTPAPHVSAPRVTSLTALRTVGACIGHYRRLLETNSAHVDDLQTWFTVRVEAARTGGMWLAVDDAGAVYALDRDGHVIDGAPMHATHAP